MKPKTILFLVLLALIIVLLIQNTQVVTFRLFFWKIAVSQIILVPLAIFTGFVVGYLLATVRKEDRKETEKKPELPK